jgi:hypothetical protein
MVNQEDSVDRGSSAAFKALVAHLSGQAAGEVNSPEQVEDLLVACWHEFEGGDDEGMVGSKLKNRTECMNWDPPVLSFTIERHGRTIGGSIYADLHRWQVNVKRMEACVDEKKGRRQLYAKAKSARMDPIAAEIADLIRQGRKDERLYWRSANCVRVNFKATVPGGVSQTFTGRKKRFKELLSSALAPEGWQGGLGGVWTKDTAGDHATGNTDD